MADRSRNISREDRAREAKNSFHKKEKPRGIGNVSPVYRVATGVFALKLPLWVREKQLIPRKMWMPYWRKQSVPP